MTRRPTPHPFDRLPIPCKADGCPYITRHESGRCGLHRLDTDATEGVQGHG